MVFHCSCSSFQIGNCLEHRLTILKKGKLDLKRCQKAIMVPTWNILTLVGVQSICTKGPACWNQCLFSLWVSVEPYSASARREKKSERMEDGEGRIDLHGQLCSLSSPFSLTVKTWSMYIIRALRSLCDVSQPLADSQLARSWVWWQKPRLELLTLALFHLCTILIVEDIPGPEFLEVWTSKSMTS